MNIEESAFSTMVFSISGLEGSLYGISIFKKSQEVECLLCSSNGRSYGSHSISFILHHGQITLSPSPV